MLVRADYSSLFDQAQPSSITNTFTAVSSRSKRKRQRSITYVNDATALTTVLCLICIYAFMMKALFYAYFDETKGQTLQYWRGDLASGHIEQTVLPSGLHHVDEDVVVFRHQGQLGIGLFTSREVQHGRGKHMGTVGMIAGALRQIRLIR